MTKESKLISQSTSSLTAEVSIRHNMAKQHMLAAAYFTRKCWDIESRLAKKEQVEYKHYAKGAIILAFASVEAAINEFYRDAIDKKIEFVQQFGAEITELLASHWKTVNRIEVLEKYRWALLIVRKPAFDKGKKTFQAVDSLRQLRNTLVHYVPEWDTEQQQHEKIEDHLRAYNFKDNPFVSSGNAFFPSKCLGHGCAEWAVQTGVHFIDSFYKRVEISTLFEGRSGDFTTR